MSREFARIDLDQWIRDALAAYIFELISYGRSLVGCVLCYDRERRRDDSLSALISQRVCRSFDDQRRMAADRAIRRNRYRDHETIRPLYDPRVRGRADLELNIELRKRYGAPS
jgi:hypothetical protein